MKDVSKCFLVGAVCLWLFADAIDIRLPVDKTEKRVLREQERVIDGEEFCAENAGCKKVRIYMNHEQEIEIRVSWIAKGCMLLLLFGLIRKTD